MVEGLPAVEYAVRIGSLQSLLVADDRVVDFAGIVRLALDAGAQVRAGSASLIAELSDTTSPQGIIGIAGFTFGSQDDPVVRSSVILAGVQDPGNVGSIYRCADAFGFERVYVGPGTCDPRTAKAVRASAGSVLGVESVRVDDVIATIKRLTDADTTVLATVSSGDTSFFNETAALAPPVAWVMGNEAHGLSAEVVAVCSRRVTIPMLGHVESLNVAAAAAVCLNWTRVKLGNPN